MPIDLAELDARYAALKAHQIPTYTGKPTPSGYVHRGRWDAHVKKHGLPPITVTIPLWSRHEITATWAAEYRREGPVIVKRTIAVDGSIAVYPETYSLDIRDIRADSLCKVLRVVTAKTETPSATIRAIVDHLAALTDAEAARWVTHSANLRALLGT